MSIFKGDSIYKSGGGSGGGYSDGGAIVDADLMKVENNAVSSYDNVSRDTINFYFEPADGEILNSIIELTTAVNATVNVYVLRNGLYYLLGNVGGDTVTAGNDYKVNITGDSYAIQQVTENSIAYLDVFGNLVPTIKIGSLLWTTENLYSLFSGLTIGGAWTESKPAAWYANNDPVANGHNGTKYNLLYNNKACEIINSEIGNSWRIATKDDINNLLAFIGGNYGYNINKLLSWGTGTNETGLTLVPNGNFSGSFLNVGVSAGIRYNGPQGMNGLISFAPGTPTSFSDGLGRACAVRLVHDA